MNSTSRCGPLLSDSGVIFRLLASVASEVKLVLDRKIAMARDGDWFALRMPQMRMIGLNVRFRGVMRTSLYSGAIPANDPKRTNLSK